MVEKLNLTPIYFIGHMLGLLVQKVQLVFIPTRDLKYVALFLEGSINHFDTKQEKWISLKKGDVQIIRAGSGISHAEELNDKSEIFQIWFDPNIQLSINEEATYDDYKSDEFSITEREGIKEKNCWRRVSYEDFL